MNECRCKWDRHFWNYTDESVELYKEKFPYNHDYYFRECPGEDKMNEELTEAREAWHMLLFVPINAGATGGQGSLSEGEKWKDSRVYKWERLQAARDALNSHQEYQKKISN